MRRTKTSLHTALIGLARETPYPSIAVKEILDRANVGKSTFYAHFRDKDDLLESGIQEILCSIQDRTRSGDALERIVGFGLRLLQHIDEHRRAAGPKMKREGRVVMHEHMRHVLTAAIADELTRIAPGRAKTQIPTELIARHVASTFVLVLNWWVDTDSALAPTDVNACFRELVLPVLARSFAQVS